MFLAFSKHPHLNVFCPSTQRCFGIWEFARKFKKNFGILEFPRKFQNSKVFWKMFWNSRKNIGILEFPRKFQKKTLEFWNSLGNSKKKTLEFWNSLGNSKIPKFQSFLEDVLEFKKKYWNFGIS